MGRARVAVSRSGEDDTGNGTLETDNYAPDTYLNYLTDTSPHHENINMNGTKPSVNPTHFVFGNRMTRDIILARTEPSQCPAYHNSRHALYTRS